MYEKACHFYPKNKVDKAKLYPVLKALADLDHRKTPELFMDDAVGYHRRSPDETKMHCMKLLGQRLMARDFDQQVAGIQIRIAVMNGFTTLGIPVTEAVG